MTHVIPAALFVWVGLVSGFCVVVLWNAAREFRDWYWFTLAALATPIPFAVFALAGVMLLSP